VIAPAGAQGLESGPAVVRAEGDAEHVAELAIEVAGARLRVFERRDDDIAQRFQPLVQQA
jgi:hypothetical protein